MKSSFLFVLLIGFSTFFVGLNEVQGQCCGANFAANEIGTHVGALRNSSTLGGLTVSGKTMHPTLLNGLHYKRYQNFSAFRLMFDYAVYDVEDNKNCVDCLEIDGKVKGGTARLGWEFIAVLNYIEPYAGADLVVTHGTYRGTEIGSDPTTGSYISLEDRRSKMGFGVGPFVGVRFFPTIGFSISAETGLDAIVAQTSVNRTYSLPETRSDNWIDSGGELLFNPVSNISLNVMF